MTYQLGKESMKIFFYIIFILFVAFILILGVKLYYTKEVDISSLENSLVTSRLLLSEDCLAKEIGQGINVDNLNEENILNCVGLNGESKQGLKIRLIDWNNTLVKEVEINKALTSQCMIGFLEEISKNYRCSYSKHYVLYGGNKGMLEVMVVNDIE